MRITRFPSLARALLQTAVSAVLLSGLTLPFFAAEAPKLRFDLPAGEARPMLRQFAAQAKCEIAFPTESVDGVKTNAVRGEMTPQEAVDRLLAGTGLTASADPKTGAFAVRKGAADPNASRAAPSAARPPGNPGEAPKPASPAADEPVVLNPFEVIADPTDSYQALNTSSISGTNRSLERLPITAEIYNATMLQDLGTSDVVDLLVNRMTGIGAGELTPGTSTAQGSSGGDRFDMQAFSVRGLKAYPRRNGFMYLGNLAEGFAYDRLEVIRGPQSLLYGNNPAGGVINVMTKKAAFDSNSFSAEGKVDGNGSERYQFDANVAGRLLGRRVAARLAWMNSEQGFWREIVRRKTQGGFAEAAVELFPASQTMLRLEFEDRSDQSVQSMRRALVSGLPAVVPNNTPLTVMLAQNQPGLAQIAGGMIRWENVDSLAGQSYYRHRWESFQTLTLSSKLTSWLQGQISAQGRAAFNDNTGSNGFTGLRAPLTGGNPLNAWAVGYRPGGAEVRSTEWGVRGTVNANFRLTRLTQNQVIAGAERTASPDRGRNLNYNYYEVDGGGAFVVNQAQLNNAERGRTLIPIQYVDITSNLAGFVDPRRPRSYTVGGKTYVWDYQKKANTVAPVANNPYGFNGGSSGATMSHGESQGMFAALFTSWLDGRFDTLLGIRHDSLVQQVLNTGAPEASGSGTTGNVGIVWKVTQPVSLYVGASSNFSPGGLNLQQRYDGGPLPNGRGESLEGGLKINGLEGRVSGSVTVFETKSVNQQASVDVATRDIIAPAGINGNYWSGITTPSYNFNARTKGLEVTLSARPVPNWRMMFGYAMSEGREGGAVVLPFYYNDEFRTNAQGQVLLGDGTPLRVPVDPSVRIAADGKTYAANVATEILTVGILKNGDANGNYRAQLSRDNGQILNAAQLGLAISGVGTGRLGLPMSDHQLGFVPPTPGFAARAGGDRTVGFPRHSLTVTSMYDFKEGWRRGIGLGVNGRADFDSIRYYYTDVAAGNIRKALQGRDTCVINLIARYRLKLARRWEWVTQVNLNNVFDQRRLEIYPNAATGLPDNAGFRNDPFNWVWTSTVRF